MEEVDIDHPIVNSDEELFVYNRNEVIVNGEHYCCPVIDSSAHGLSFLNFIGLFDTKADTGIDVYSTVSDVDGVLEETENMINFSHINGGLLTETAVKKIIEEITHFNEHNEPSEEEKEAARQGCTVAKQLGWNDIIPDEDERHWYDLT